MAKQIIYGIGKAILRDFRNPKTVIGFADLQDLSVESTSSMEDVAGGNRLFPIASFKKEAGLKVSATSATFNSGMTEYMDGATKSTGATAMSDVMDVAIPESKEIDLDGTPVEDSISVEGFTKASGAEPTTGQYSVSGKKLTFSADDIGKSVVIVYDYNSSESAVTYSVSEMSLAKPFIFDYIFPIYDEDSQQTHKGQIKIYKAQCTSGFKISASDKSPFAPQFEASARDPKRVDKKLWCLMIDGIEI